MSLAEPKHAEEIEQAKAAEKAKRHKYLVGVVFANGDVQGIVCLPPEKGLIGPQRGDCPVIWMNGRAQVTERWEKKGVTLLEDRCKADGCPEKYERWRQAQMHTGKVQIDNVLDLYPPSVLRLRRESETGVVEGKVFDARTGTLVERTADAMASRVAELAESAGIGRPTKADRTATPRV